MCALPKMGRYYFRLCGVTILVAMLNDDDARGGGGRNGYKNQSKVQVVCSVAIS